MLINSLNANAGILQYTLEIESWFDIIRLAVHPAYLALIITTPELFLQDLSHVFVLFVNFESDRISLVSNSVHDVIMLIKLGV